MLYELTVAPVVADVAIGNGAFEIELVDHALAL